MDATATLRRVPSAVRRSSSPVLALTLAVLLLIGWFSAGRAQAAVTSFDLSPTSGPAGTVVQISGAGCSPGLSLLASSDFVAVSAPSLGVAVHVPVSANGSWHGSITVPASSGPGPVLVAAACVSDGLASFTTIYTPQVFTITAAPTTTAPTTTPATSADSTPTTEPTSTTNPSTVPGTSTPARGGTTSTPGGGQTSSSTVPVVGGVPPGGSNGGANGGGGGGSASHSGGAGAVKTDATLPAGHKTSGRAAALSVPELPAAHVAGSGGFGWLVWLLLIALLAAAVASALLVRRNGRDDVEPAVVGDALGDAV